MKKNERSTYRNIITCVVIIILLFLGTIEINIYFSLKRELNNIDQLLAKEIVTVVISIAASIVASLIFACMEREKPIDEEQLKKLIAQLGAVERIKYAPSRVYLGTDITHEDFNNFLNRKIGITKKYYYMGDKAKYLFKRLKHDVTKTNAKLQIEVLLPDITDESLFKSRLKQLRMEAKHYRSQADEKLLEKEKKDVLKSLYLLKSLENKYDIKIYFHREIPLYRIEITDDAMIISLLTALIDGNYYPITFVYEHEMQLREAYLDYIEEVKERSRVISNIDITDEYLIVLGKNYINKSFSLADLENCDLVEGREREC